MKKSLIGFLIIIVIIILGSILKIATKTTSKVVLKSTPKTIRSLKSTGQILSKTVIKSTPRAIKKVPLINNKNEHIKTCNKIIQEQKDIDAVTVERLKLINKTESLLNNPRLLFTETKEKIIELSLMYAESGNDSIKAKEIIIKLKQHNCFTETSICNDKVQESIKWFEDLSKIASLYSQGLTLLSMPLSLEDEDTETVINQMSLLQDKAQSLWKQWENTWGYVALNCNRNKKK